MNYHTYYKDDRCALKLVVYGLAVLTTLKSAQVLFVLSSLFERKALIPIDKKNSLLVWMQSIVYFTEIEGAIQLSYNAWWQVGNAVMVSEVLFLVFK